MKNRNVITIFIFIFAGFINAEENALPVNWQDLPEPYHTKSAVNPPIIIPRPEDAELTLDEGFIIEE